MAARLNRMHQDSVREKIKVSNIITRLQKHIDGEIEMTPAQVTSAKILLDKSISNAPQINEHNHTGGVAHKIVFETIVGTLPVGNKNTANGTAD